MTIGELFVSVDDDVGDDITIVMSVVGIKGDKIIGEICWYRRDHYYYRL